MWPLPQMEQSERTILAKRNADMLKEADAERSTLDGLEKAQEAEKSWQVLTELIAWVFRRLNCRCLHGRDGAWTLLHRKNRGRIWPGEATTCVSLQAL